jgi:hypothetical protein
MICGVRPYIIAPPEPPHPTFSPREIGFTRFRHPYSAQVGQARLVMEKE